MAFTPMSCGEAAPLVTWLPVPESSDDVRVRPGALGSFAIIGRPAPYRLRSRRPIDEALHRVPDRFSFLLLDRRPEAEIREDEIRRLEVHERVEDDRQLGALLLGGVALDDRVAVLLVPAQLTHVGEVTLPMNLNNWKPSTSALASLVTIRSP